MSRINSTIATAMLLAVIIAVSFPASLSAVIINGSTVTLQAADRTSNNTSLIQGYLNNATYTKIIIQPGTSGASWLTGPGWIFQ